jgi:hypothetical protein
MAGQIGICEGSENGRDEGKRHAQDHGGEFDLFHGNLLGGRMEIRPWKLDVGCWLLELATF